MDLGEVKTTDANNLKYFNFISYFYYHLDGLQPNNRHGSGQSND